MDRKVISAEIAVARAAGDVAALTDIIGRLGHRTEPWVGTLRINAIQARLQARQGGEPRPAHWLERYGLPKPNGRPLYRYAMSDAAFERAEGDLKARASRFNADLATRHDAALFVLWSSAWFRRCYDGGMQRWADVARRLGLQPEQSRLRRWTDEGLRYWGQAPLKMNNTHHRLAAIARQGGFPTAAIRDGAGGWAAAFLKKLVGRLLDQVDPSSAVAEALSEELEGGIPETWRHPEILVVSAELALAIVELRREAEGAGVTEGSLVSEWLDQNRSDWRRTLPLALDETGARQLVDGLIRTERLKGGHGSAQARRFMVHTNGVLRHQIELDLEGDLVNAEPSQGFDDLAREWSRLRMFAGGDSARYISGELAVVEPDEGGRWRCMRSRVHPRFDLPLDVPLMIELRGEGIRVAGPFLLPGGEAIRSDLRICVGDPSTAGELPCELQIVGQASGSYRGEPLFVDAPIDWKAIPHEEGSACREVGDLFNRRQWEVCGAALFESPRGDPFLVRAGQKGDQRDAIVLAGDAPPRCVSTDGLPVYLGPPMPRFRQGLRLRTPETAETGWRRRGQREWSAKFPDGEVGVWEIAWRDATTRHIRAKTEVIVLPKAFEIASTRTGDLLSVELRGWPWAAISSQGSLAGDKIWRLRSDTLVQPHFEIRLDAPGSQAISLRTPLRYHAWIFDWSGAQLARDSRISISTLNRFVARAPGRCELVAELLGPNRQPLPQANMRWKFADELPLSLISDDLAALLRGSSQIDAVVRLDFHDGRPNHWFVVEFGHLLRDEPRGLVPFPAVSDEQARLVARSMGTPQAERDLGAYGLAEQINVRPINVDAGDGPALLYLRANDRILSRPRIVNGDPLKRMPETALGRIMVSGSLDRQADLEALIDSCLANLADAASLKVIHTVTELAASLDGLPPATFDVLKLLETRPLLGPLMLFGAPQTQIEPLLRLSNGLRMAWCLIPSAYWMQAWEIWGRHFADAFPDRPGDVASLMTGKRHALIAHEPVLASHLGQARSAEPIAAIANDFLNRAQDRIRTEIVNPFRTNFGNHLPCWVFDPGYWRALDAPLVAALIAQGKAQIPLSDAELFAVKDIARSHPRYFQAAFAAQFTAK